MRNKSKSACRFQLSALGFLLSTFCFLLSAVGQPLPSYQTPFIRTNLNYSTSAADARTRLGVTGGFYLAAGSGVTVGTNGSLFTVSLYTAPSITSLVNDKNTLEIGSSATSTKLDWVLAGAAITSQSLDNGIGALNLTNRTYTYTGTYTTDRTFILTCSDGVTTPTAGTSVT